jgi:hypothetical protein
MMLVGVVLIPVRALATRCASFFAAHAVPHSLLLIYAAGRLVVLVMMLVGVVLIPVRALATRCASLFAAHLCRRPSGGACDDAGRGGAHPCACPCHTLCLTLCCSFMPQAGWWCL